MAVCNLLDLAGCVPPGAPLFGLDLGEKSIGVAVSDTHWMIASPLTVIRRTRFSKPDAQLLFAIDGRARGSGALVVGLPLNMDGSEGPSAQSARAFARNLLRLADLPIAFWDERLSSVAVNRALIEEGDTTRFARARKVDKLAATWILQGALDRLRNAEGHPKAGL